MAPASTEPEAGPSTTSMDTRYSGGRGRGRGRGGVRGRPPSAAPSSAGAGTAARPGRGRGRPRNKGLPKLNWQRPVPGESSEEEVIFPDDHIARPSAARSDRATSSAAPGPDEHAAQLDAFGHERDESVSPAGEGAKDEDGSRKPVVERTTKSGRKVVKPANIVPSTEPSFYRNAQRRALASKASSTPSQGQNSKSPEQSTRTVSARPAPSSPNTPILCEVCELSRSSAANRLVPCEVCGKAYHQLCSSSAISFASSTVSTSTSAAPNDQAWFCDTCAAQRALLAPLRQYDERIPGADLLRKDKEEYLARAPHATLLELLLELEDRHPDARLYPPDLQQLLVADRRRRRELEASIGKGPAKRSREPAEPATEGPSSPSGTKRRRILVEPISGPGNAATAFDDSVLDPALFPSAEIEKEAIAPTAPTAPLDPALLSAGKTADTSVSPSLSPLLDSATVQSKLPKEKRVVPGYEDMAVEALRYIDDRNGTPPKIIFQWMYDSYPLQDNFKPSAGQAIQKAYRRGRLLKSGSLYTLNPAFDEASLQGKKPTRRPRLATSLVSATRVAGGPKPREEYATPLELVNAHAHAQNRARKDAQGTGEAEAEDDEDMLLEPEDEEEGDEIDEDDGNEDGAAALAQQQFLNPLAFSMPSSNMGTADAQDAELESFLKEFMETSPAGAGLGSLISSSSGAGNGIGGSAVTAPPRASLGELDQINSYRPLGSTGNASDQDFQRLLADQGFFDPAFISQSSSIAMPGRSGTFVTNKNPTPTTALQHPQVAFSNGLPLDPNPGTR